MDVPFVPLTLQLAQWFDHDREALPESVRDLLKDKLILDTLWDSISPDQRRSAAAQWDYQHDPALEQERTHYWNLWCEIDELETELKRLKELRPVSYEGDHVKRKEIRDLESRIALFKENLDSPFAGENEESAKNRQLKLSTSVVRTSEEASEVVVKRLLGATGSELRTEPLVPDEAVLSMPLPGVLDDVSQGVGPPRLDKTSEALPNASPSNADQLSTDREPCYRLIHCGDFWRVQFGAREVLLKTTVGLHLLRHLLRHAGKSYTPYELRMLMHPVAPEFLPGSVEESEKDDDQEEFSEEFSLDGADDSGQVIDDKTRSHAIAKMKSLQELREDKLERGDDEGAAKAADEIDEIASYLTAAQGLNGKSRKMGGDFERVRLWIAVNITRVKQQIDKELPEMTAHLNRSLRIGTTCIYDPEIEIDWNFGDF